MVIAIIAIIPNQIMKYKSSFLMVAALILPAAGLQTNLTTRGPAGSGRVSQAGYVLKPIPPTAVHHQLVGLPRFRFWESTSGNWSGYAVPLDTSHRTDTFSDVQGAWTVPTVKGAKNSTTYSSVWLGLDG